MFVRNFTGRQELEDITVRTMHEDRKRVFKDLLKWDVPIENGQYEFDQFDNEHATYIAVCSEDGCHLASARILPTLQDHILGSIFPYLSDRPVPVGDRVAEITRFCLSPSQTARQRIDWRRRLVTALAEHGLASGFTTYTGVAQRFWFDQIKTFGWRCSSLGTFLPDDRNALVGLRIDLDEQTLAQLRANGMYVNTPWNPVLERFAA